jgi:protein tyrosine phosphatase (PTP) superfamily phosphohydrolase (DUF442 family)
MIRCGSYGETLNSTIPETDARGIMKNLRYNSGACALLMLFGTACGAPSAESASDAAASSAAAATSMAGDQLAAIEVAAAALSVATDMEVRSARSPMPGVITAGQPTQEQLEALNEAGVTHFISLRPTAEGGAGWEEAHAADGSYDFDRLPISGAASLTRENVDIFATMLEKTGGAPTVLYCASSNRVGAMLALKAHWIDGVDAAEALEIGLAAGMTRLEAPVRELLGLES